MSLIVAADVPDILRAAGFKVGVVPDFLTNGHGSMRSVDGHMIHHTGDDATLRSVYAWPGRWGDVRPSVPSPRCNVWWPETDFEGFEVWCVSAGMAYHAGDGSTVALADARAGRMSKDVPDAAARGLADDGAAGSAVLLGHEVQNTGLVGDVYEQEDRVARGIAAINNAAGLTAGHVTLHRKNTRRKPDWSFPDSADVWSQIHSYQLATPEEDPLAGITLDDIGDEIDKRLRAQLGPAFYQATYGDAADDSQDKGTHPYNLQALSVTLRKAAADSAAREAALLTAVQQIAASQGSAIDYDRLQTMLDDAAKKAVDSIDLDVVRVQSGA